MKIKVKSIEENWDKESRDVKCNTVRVLDGKDIIEVENDNTGEIFQRVITDITVWKGQIIISWRPN